MVDILLINPSNISLQNNPIPFGLTYIASLLEKNNFSVKILDLSVQKMSDSEILEYADRINPKKIGISCMSVHVDFVDRITKKIKEKFKDMTIIVGGIHPTALPDESIKGLPNVDIFVIGEGELTILEIMQNRDLKKINGIIYKDKGKIKINPKREYIENLDTLPAPARHLLTNPKAYNLSFDWEGRKPATTIFSSRGCPFNCIYCASKVMWNRKVRFRSAENVLDEIDFLIKKYKIKEILFYDDHFVLDKKRLYKICNELIKRKYDLTWCCLARVDSLDIETAKLMKRAGCHMISFGVESGSQTILNSMNKNTDVSKIIKTFKICKEAGINTKASFIFGAPKETELTIKETQRLLKKILPDYVWFFTMTPLPGTELYRMHKDAGIISNDWSKYDQTTYNKFFDTTLEYERLREVVSETYRHYYFSTEYLFSQLKKMSLRKVVVFFTLIKNLQNAIKYIQRGRVKDE